MAQKSRRPRQPTRRLVIPNLDAQLARYLELLVRDSMLACRSPQAVAVHFIMEGIQQRIKEGCPILRAEIARINKAAPGIEPEAVWEDSPLARCATQLPTMQFQGNQAAVLIELVEGGFFGTDLESVIRFLVTKGLEEMRLKNSPFLRKTAARIAAQV